MIRSLTPLALAAFLNGCVTQSTTTGLADGDIQLRCGKSASVLAYSDAGAREIEAIMFELAEESRAASHDKNLSSLLVDRDCTVKMHPRRTVFAGFNGQPERIRVIEIHRRPENDQIIINERYQRIVGHDQRVRSLLWQWVDAQNK